MVAQATKSPATFHAYCWANGLIQIGRAVPANAIRICSGSRYRVSKLMVATARHGMGGWTGKLLVPGIPEAENQRAAGDALKAFINWLKKGRRHTPGVSFGTMR